MVEEWRIPGIDTVIPRLGPEGWTKNRAWGKSGAEPQNGFRQFQKMLHKEISPIAFGCDPLGGHNWGNVDPQAIMAAVPHAIEHGVTLFDTADCYGNGLSEMRLGQALSNKRHNCLVASKFGVRIGADGKTSIDNRPEWIVEAVEASLTRLGTDYIDIYQLHWWDKKTPFAEIFETLGRLVTAGKIRSFGSTNVTLEMMGLNSASELPSAYVSSSMEFSLVHTSGRVAIERMCGSPNAPAFLSWGSLGGGMLSGKYRSAADFDENDRRLKRGDSHFTGARLDKNLRIVDLCREIAKTHGDNVKVAQVALQWIRKSLGFGTCLVGIKGEQQLNEAVGAFAFTLSHDDVRRLDEAAAAPC